MIKPSLRFKGNAAEAIDFYESLFKGTDKLVLRYCDMPLDQSTIPPESKNLIGHAEMTFCGTTFTFCDAQDCAGNGNQVSFMVIFNTAREVEKVFNTLAKDGKVIQELAPQFYAKLYGWVRDKFGIEWQIITGE